MKWELPRGTGTPRDDTVALTRWLAHTDLKSLSDPNVYPRIVLSSNPDALGDGLFLGLTERDAWFVFRGLLVLGIAALLFPPAVILIKSARW